MQKIIDNILTIVLIIAVIDVLAVSNLVLIDFCVRGFK